MAESMPNDRREGRDAKTAPAGPWQATSIPVIPDHELLRCIGIGSYGEVWLARNIMGTYRAIKIVYRRRFVDDTPYEREFRGIQKFEPISRSHEGLVDILQMGRNDAEGYFYYVMELCDDPSSMQRIDAEKYQPKTLEHEIRVHGRLKFEVCIELSLSLASALEHLHRHSLIHRDIKPSSILFVNGVPKIGDVGLVANIGSSGSFVGTEGFIPPEGPGTPQADIYSFGKVLYEISTGADRKLFPLLPSGVTERDRSSLLELNQVILRACEENPRKRYQSFGQVSADLILLRAGKSLKRMRLLERRLVYATRLGGIVLALGLVATAALYQARRTTRQTTQRLAESYVAYGSRSIEEGDLIGSLPWFGEALRLEPWNATREKAHRIRLGSVLRACPAIVQMWFEDHEINSCSVSSDGQRILAATVAGTATIHDLTNPSAEHRVLRVGKDMNSASFSRDGRFIATASVDGRVGVWEAGPLRLIAEFKHPSEVSTVTFHPSGDMLLTSCWDNRGRVWRISTRELVCQFTNHTGPVMCASFNLDGSRVVTASQDGTASVASLTSQQLVGHQPWKHRSWIYHASFSPDDRLVATASFDRLARVTDVVSGRLVDFRHRAPVRSAEFSPDGRYLVTACWDSTARVWDIATGEPAMSPLKHSGNVMHACFTPDGRYVVAVDTQGVTCLWDLAPSTGPALTGHVLGGGPSLSPTNLWTNLPADTAGKVALAENEPPQPLHVTVNSDATKLLTVSAQPRPDDAGSRSWQIWDSATGRPITSEWPYPQDGERPCLNFDGSLMACVTGPAHNLVRVWQVADGRVLLEVNHETNVIMAAFDRQGRQLATVSRKGVKLWDATSGNPLLSFPVQRRISHVEFSPDGRHLAVSCSDTSLSPRYAQIWETRSGRPAGPLLNHSDGVEYVSFSQDGKRVITAGEDRQAAIWSVETGVRIGSPLRHPNEVLQARFSSDDSYVVTICRDGTVRVWDGRTGELLAPPIMHFEVPDYAQFLGASARLLTTSSGQYYLWDLPEDQRPIQDLLLMTQLLSAHQTDQTGAWPLSAQALQRNWLKFRERKLTLVDKPSEDPATWHERQAYASEKAEQWFAVLFHLDHLRALRPGDATLVQRWERAEAKSEE